MTEFFVVETVVQSRETREYPHRQDDGREQSEEPPAEYWEQRARQQETDEYTAGSDDETFGRPEGRL